MMRPALRRTLLSLCVLSVFGTSVLIQDAPAVAGTRKAPPGNPGPTPGGPPPAQRLEPVLIRTAKPYAQVVAAIERQGGIVTQQFKYFDGLAAQVPRAALAAIGAITGPESIKKDLMVTLQEPRDAGLAKAGLPPVIGDARSILVESTEAIEGGDLPAFAAAHPEAYLVNDAISNASALHAGGITGDGVIVAVIDSGIRPGFQHLTVDGSVIGGEDFVGDGLGFSSPFNNGHGTFVSGMISANLIARFSLNTAFVRAVRNYAPGAIVGPNRCVGGPTPGATCNANTGCGSGGTCTSAIPMIGSAPLSSIYALRVFGPAGGAPTSRLLQAVDRAIELRELYEDGLPGGINIQVVNMSIGGPNLYPGQEFFDRGVSALLDHDIVAVVSASNAGPSGLTIGSPGSSLEVLTAGGASLAHNERIVRDLQFGPNLGGFFRPSSGIQTVYFSSRGPNADGRRDPDVIVNADWCYGMGFSATNAVNFAGGTSFSAPTVAGIAALLRQAFPAATARQVRNAIIATANPTLLADGSSVLDQGAGYADALAARNLLGTGTVPDTSPAPPPFTHKVRDNVEDNAGLTVLTGSVVRHVGPLKPGQRAEILYQIQPNISRVFLSLSNVTPALPPSQQNQLFGDDVLLTVHSAKTSKHANLAGDGDYLIYGFTLGGSAFLERPESGLMRITVNGDWTNAGDISADVTLASLTDPVPQITKQGKIGQSELIMLPFTIAPGVSTAEFRLIFREDWSNYPVSDVDMFLIPPDGNFNFVGATLDNPESVLVNKPMPGDWMVVIHGFEVHVPDDRYELRVKIDGAIVR